MSIPDKFNYDDDAGLPGAQHDWLCGHCAQRTGVKTCNAFPDGIPYELMANLKQHNKPYPGDHDVVYQPEVWYTEGGSG